MAVNPNTRRGRDIARFGIEHVRARDARSRERVAARIEQTASRLQVPRSIARRLDQQSRRVEREERREFRDSKEWIFTAAARQAYAQLAQEHGELWTINNSFPDFLARIRRGGNVTVETAPGVHTTYNIRRLYRDAQREGFRRTPGGAYERLLRAAGIRDEDIAVLFRRGEGRYIKATFKEIEAEEAELADAARDAAELAEDDDE